MVTKWGLARKDTFIKMVVFNPTCQRGEKFSKKRNPIFGIILEKAYYL